MPESINIFTGGMNSDMSPTYQEKNTYVNALNIELLNTELQGSVAISNSKGNKLLFTLPSVSEIYKLTILDEGTSDIVINGITSATSFTVTSTTTISDLYSFITSDANFDLTEIDIYYNDVKLILVSVNQSLTISVSNTNVVGGTTATYIPTQSGIQPIGYGVINDDIYIFSTNCTDIDPQVNGGGYGQIWKLTYDNIGFDSSLSAIDLVYSADLSFTTYYHIPQTAVVTRYENSTIQRIYWTDNYNRVRNINLKDPQVFTLDVSLLDLVSSVDFNIPILTEIQNGGIKTIKVGTYQIAYRLKNTTGATTAFSPLSNMVYVTTGDEANSTLSNLATAFSDYRGDPFGSTIAKTISWNISDVDIDYDRIEVVVLIRQEFNDNPEIYSFFEDSISGRDSIDVTLDGDILDGENVYALSLNEFIALSGYFTHAKTLVTKDNCLIAGNLRVASLDLEYDARVYRFTSGANPTFDLIENGSQNQYYATDYDNIDEESDAINPDQDIFKYQSDGLTIGGSGPNISYEFINIAIESDTGDGANNSSSLNIGSQQLSPFRKTANDTPPFSNEVNLNVYSSDNNNADALQEYSLSIPVQTFEDMKFPQYNSNYWGYQENEIYRMGIQFYDKAKNPYFVKWIGDIKFPTIGDPINPLNSTFIDGEVTGQTTFVKSFVAMRTGKPYAAYITQLGIKFNISIPVDISEQVSGYSIVRVKREENDKTVIAEGIITNVGDNTSANAYYTPDPGVTHFLTTYVLAEPSVCYFNTPNHLIPGITEPRAGDFLNIRRAFSIANANTTTQLGGSGDPYYIYKLYNEVSINELPNELTQSLNLGIDQDSFALNGYNVNNNDDQGHSSGNQCYFFTLTNALTNYNNTTYKLYATIDRVVSNQYGGNTFSDRATNEYILCSHFRGIKNSTTVINDSPNVFGGDTQNYHIDMQRMIKKWDGGSAPLESTTFYFPAGCVGQVGMRYGTFVNKNLNLDDGTQSSGTETYEYNRVYSCENDIIKFYPKPDPFIENTEFNNRFRISEIKINGELSDSWRVFKENNYWDVEGVFGPINSSLIMSDKLYFWQNRAFGVMQVNPRAIIQDINSTSLQVGTGLPLQRHDYISTTVGTRHQSSTIGSDRKLYWYDTNTKKIYTFSSEGVNPFSDLKGLFSYLSNNLDGQIQNIDKPLYESPSIGVNGIAATYDYKRHKAIFTFNSGKDLGRNELEQKSFTVAINELNNTFLSFYSYKPKMYINDFKYIFSANNDSLSDIYIHDVNNYCLFYDVIYPTYIKYIVNDNPAYTKVFDNIVWDTQAKNGIININDDTWKSIRVTNDYQNTDTIPLVYDTNIKRKERSWQLAIPRNRVLYTASNSPDIYTDLSPTAKPFGERIRDKYISVELTYDNNLNYQLLTNNIKTIYRISDR